MCLVNGISFLHSTKKSAFSTDFLVFFICFLFVNFVFHFCNILSVFLGIFSFVSHLLIHFLIFHLLISCISIFQNLLYLLKNTIISYLYFSINSVAVNISGFSISTSLKSLSPVINISTSDTIAELSIGKSLESLIFILLLFIISEGV